jgi:hypothetical protein
LKSSPTDSGDWWESLKQGARRLLPDGPVNHMEPGKPIPIGIKLPGKPFFVGTAKDLPDPEAFYLPDGSVLDIDKMLEENTRLLEDLQKTRGLLRDAQHAESLLARRVEVFRKKWPDIHKKFFTTKKRKAQ